MHSYNREIKRRFVNFGVEFFKYVVALVIVTMFLVYCVGEFGLHIAR